MKKLEIEKTKPAFILSVLKVDMIKVGLVFSISNFFITKTSLANKWIRKKIPSCSNSALEFLEKHQLGLYLCTYRANVSVHRHYVIRDRSRGRGQIGISITPGPRTLSV